MSNQSDGANQKLRTVQDVIHVIEKKCVDGTYLFRGEPERHEGDPYYGKVSSTLWRKYREEAKHCDIEAIQNEMLNGAKKHLGHIAQDIQSDLNAVMNVSKESTRDAANFELLTEIQHYGGATNLIDFTTDYFIALFFACDGFPQEEGRVVIQNTESIKNMIRHPNNPRHRVIAQKSVFLRPPKGFIDPYEKDIVFIPATLKHPLLQHLRRYHGISKETIYNDLHGYIIHQGIHEGAYTLFFKGVACQHSGQYGESIEHYTKAIRVKPDFTDAYFNRGRAYGDEGDFDRAIEDYTKVIDLNPKDIDAYYNRGCENSRKNNYDAAIGDYDSVIRLEPSHSDAYINRGKAFFHNGRIDRAIQDLTKAIDLNPNNANALNNRGVSFAATGDYSRAIQEYDSAIKLNGNYAEAYNNRGNAWLCKGKIHRAIGNYTKAIDLKPNYANAFNNRGIAYAKKGKYYHAIEDFDRALGLEPDLAEAYDYRAKVHGDSGRYDLAIKDHDKAIELNFTTAYYSRGVFWLQQSEFENAKEDLSIGKEKGADIVALFRKDYESVAHFEQKNNVELPEDIAVMLSPPGV